MNTQNLTSEKVRQLLSYTDRRETLQREIAELDQTIGRIVGGGTVRRQPPVHRNGATTSKRASKPQSRMFGRGELTKKAEAIIGKAGSSGVSPADLAEKLHCSLPKNVWPWWYTTAKKAGRIERIKSGEHKGNFVLKAGKSEK